MQIEYFGKTSNRRIAPEYANNCILGKVGDPFETNWYLSDDMGLGAIQRMELRRGFDLFTMNYKPKETLVLKSEYNQSVLAFGFIF